MDHAVQNQIHELQNVREQILRLGAQNQLAEIRRLSPYSDTITLYIRQYDELRLYYTLQLKESNITRPALIRDIAFDLWISSVGCTNLDLMLKGSAPYLFDAPEGKIELHHIGQECSAPFAELTLDEHNENSHLLHVFREDSWRQDEQAEKAFYKERSAYWKKRANHNHVVAEYQFEQMPPYGFPAPQEYTEELQKTCEAIYSQFDADRLDYLSDLARSYAMMHRVGASTMGEFLKDTQQTNQATVRCAACRSTDYVLHGTYKAQGERVQRYKCKSCGKVFTSTYKSLVSGSSFSFRDWIKFIDCLYNGYTLRQIEKACDISGRTAYENRARLFYALKLLNDKVQLRGNVVLDETYLPVSYKGNHTKQDNFIMPRSANERGGENHAKGLSQNLVCIVCALDDSGTSVAKVAGTGAASAAKLKYVLQEHMGEDVVCLYSDKSAAIRSFAETCGLKIKQEKLLRKGTQQATGVPRNKATFVVNRYLQIINGYHSRLKKFLSRFAGISTKHLSGYLYLFAWKERNKDREPEEAYKELLCIMTQPNHYLPVDDIISGEYVPNAIGVNARYRKRISDDLKRDKEIYRRYAAGETMTSIAADYGVTKQRISVIVQKLRKNGMAYRTESDIKREQAREPKPKARFRKGQEETLARDYQIYAERMRWQGTPDEFNKNMALKYGISIQTVKNIVSQIKRVLRLREEIFIYENISYRSLKEIYQSVYTEYLTLKETNPGLTFAAHSQLLADRYNFAQRNIARIVQIMKGDTAEAYLNKKRRLTKTETYNRDKAVFIDYLRWTGTKKDFYCYATQKYALSYKMLSTIIKYCLSAVPERCDLI